MSKKNASLVRALAAQQVLAVTQQGQSLATLSTSAEEKKLSPVDKSLQQAICYGVLRHYYSLAACADSLINKPFRRKDQVIYCLLLVGIYQLQHMRIPPHAAVAETVAATSSLGKSWAKGVLNASLRALLRRDDTLASPTPEATWEHPHWLIDAIQQAWPHAATPIFAANNQQAPMVLRVSPKPEAIRRLIQHVDAEISEEGTLSAAQAYCQLLALVGIAARMHDEVDSAVVLEKAVAVEQLPGFAEGLVSVQDAAPQLAATLLAPQRNQRVLDACAAPGGKTAHLYQQAPELSALHAIEIEPVRAEKLTQTLERTQTPAQVIIADASQPAIWWDNIPYDRILCDAPCSATGVIRRHPDIKFLRRAADITALADKQLQLLNALWKLLAEGGQLLYCTCSILPEENDQVIEKFIKQEKTAKRIPIQASWGNATEYGRQIFPGDMDGFYYALLEK